MLKNEREREIINILNERGFVSVRELCRVLYASESSVRRDLSSLEGRGIIRRSHGGAEPIINPSGGISFNHRSHHNVAAKRAIAARAAEFIKDGDLVFLDQSSTAFYLAERILSNQSLTIVTNNVEIINLLSSSGIKAFSSGGYLSNENRTCLVGIDACRIFESINADAAFFSTKAISYEGVIYDCNREEVLVRQAMLNNARKRIYLCDGEKLGTLAAYKQTTSEEVDYIVNENFCIKGAEYVPFMHKRKED